MSIPRHWQSFSMVAYYSTPGGKPAKRDVVRNAPNYETAKIGFESMLKSQGCTDIRIKQKKGTAS